jgi:hypothetical protein
MPDISVVNDVVFTQVCMAMEDDSRTAAVTAHLVADGVAFACPSTLHDRAVLRFSVRNWPRMLHTSYAPSMPSCRALAAADSEASFNTLKPLSGKGPSCRRYGPRP